jgi:hypothetical protein
MARGWESKSVEDQIDAATVERSRSSAVSLTPEERERLERRSSLLLARAKTASDLEAARDPRYKDILERALAHLDAQLADLSLG